MPASPANGLDPAAWARLRRALEDALDRPVDERRGWLTAELGDVPELLARALELLSQDDGAPPTRTPLERGLPDAGIVVGPWVTRRLLGRGGMGEVFLASRADGAFERLVALKTVRPHLGSEDLVARFRRERQLQATLQHPGIARMLDGGTGEDGAPYIVMEYVEGLRIDRFCDEFRLTVRERVELFRQVVDAVAHAHERRIVHRDIKPSNILVGASGQPKLLDFGIARVLDPELTNPEHDVTRESIGFATPSYASPEQLRGRPPSSATDVYSLGVLLYELLAGVLPFRLDGLSAAEAEHRVQAEEARAPSEGLAEDAAQARRTTERGLRAAVRGDLDRIALFCLRKEPQRRYANAAALAADIDRFLEGRPVQARPDTPLYRTLKFLGRNRGPVAAAGVAFGSLALGLVAAMDKNAELRAANRSIVEQKSLADSRLESLRNLRRRTVAEMQRVFLEVPGALRASETLLETVAENLEEETLSTDSGLELLREIGETYRTLGAAYYSGRGPHLGRSAAARSSYERALAALDRARELAPRDPALVLETAEVLDDLAAVLLVEGQRDQAHECHRRTLDALAAFSDVEVATNVNLLSAATHAREALARSLQSFGRYDEARIHAERTLEDWKRFLGEHPNQEPFLAGQIAILEVPLASIMCAQGDFAPALDLLDGARPHLEESLALHPGTSVTGRSWITFWRTRGAALEGLGDGRATAAYRRAVDVSREAFETAPMDARARQDLIIGLATQGEALLREDRLREAGRALSEAVDLAREHAAEERDAMTVLRRRARCELALGELRLAEGDLLEASELLGGATRTLREVLDDSDSSYSTRKLMRDAHLATAKLDLAQLGLIDREDQPARARQAKHAAEALDAAQTLAAEDAALGIGASEPTRALALVDSLRARCPKVP